MLSTGSTQEYLSRHDRKNVDRDVKNQTNTQNNVETLHEIEKTDMHYSDLGKFEKAMHGTASGNPIFNHSHRFR